MENENEIDRKTFFNKILIHKGFFLIFLGISVRIIMLFYYYYTHLIDSNKSWGDVAFNYNRYSSSIYPPFTMLLLIFFISLSFGSIYIFAFWAFFLDMLTSLMFYLVLKSFDIPKRKYILGLFLINPFFFLSNSFSLDNCGYHITDAFFFFFLFLALIFYPKKDLRSKILFYVFLGISMTVKIFTIPAVGLFFLKFFFDKDWKEMKIFLLSTIPTLFFFLILPLLFWENPLITLIRWNERGDSFIPLYIRIIPILLIVILFLLFRFKKADLFEIIIISIIAVASFIFFSNPFVRYFQPLIFYGILKEKEFGTIKINLGLFKGDLKIDNHFLTFVLSIIAVLIAYLMIIFIFPTFYSAIA